MLGNIMDKLGFKGDTKAAGAAQAPARSQRQASAERRGSAPPKPGTATQAQAASETQTTPAAPTQAPPRSPTTTPAGMQPIDVTGKLQSLAAVNPQKLNWKESIVDLLKLLDIDSSLAARKELAIELGCPAEKMGDSAQMNVWLHKTVLQKLAENGGNVPRELLD